MTLSDFSTHLTTDNSKKGTGNDIETIRFIRDILPAQLAGIFLANNTHDKITAFWLVERSAIILFIALAAVQLVIFSPKANKMARRFWNTDEFILGKIKSKAVNEITSGSPS